jgi:hypothetical protein
MGLPMPIGVDARHWELTDFDRRSVEGNRSVGDRCCGQ